MYLCNLLLVAIYVFTIHIQLAVDEVFIILLQKCVTGTERILEVGVTTILRIFVLL